MTLTVEASRVVDAPLPLVWGIVSDLGGYHRHTDTLIETTVVSGEGQAAVRRCVDAGKPLGGSRPTFGGSLEW